MRGLPFSKWRQRISRYGGSRGKAGVYTRREGRGNYFQDVKEMKKLISKKLNI